MVGPERAHQLRTKYGTLLGELFGERLRVRPPQLLPEAGTLLLCFSLQELATRLSGDVPLPCGFARFAPPWLKK